MEFHLDERYYQNKAKYMTGVAYLRLNITRSDTRLPKSRAGGQGPYLRPLHHLGRSSKAKDRNKKVNCDGPTD